MKKILLTLTAIAMMATLPLAAKVTHLLPKPQEVKIKSGTLKCEVNPVISIYTKLWIVPLRSRSKHHLRPYGEQSKKPREWNIHRKRQKDLHKIILPYDTHKTNPKSFSSDFWSLFYTYDGCFYIQKILFTFFCNKIYTKNTL